MPRPPAWPKILQVRTPQLSVRESEQDTNRCKTLFELKLISPQEFSQQENLDFAQKQKQWKEAEKAGFAPLARAGRDSREIHRGRAPVLVQLAAQEAPLVRRCGC
jgi:hypothetical protein